MACQIYPSKRLLGLQKMKTVFLDLLAISMFIEYPAATFGRRFLDLCFHPRDLELWLGNVHVTVSLEVFRNRRYKPLVTTSDDTEYIYRSGDNDNAFQHKPLEAPSGDQHAA
jgi:hypothetical protein